MKSFMPGVISFLFTTLVFGQKEYTVACIAFYNLENLFDTIDSPDTDDLEFTPAGSNIYTSKVYYDKLAKLSKVISEIGTEYTPDGAAILGVSEIENLHVLEDLVKQPAIAHRGYKILHQNSKDGRGIDVALLYQPKYFTPDTVTFHALITNQSENELRYSRDILIAVGDFTGEPMAFTVNHWPSRRGGEQITAHMRNAAALCNRQKLDSLRVFKGIKKSVVMGDLNDDPVNDSVRKYLKASGQPERLDEDEMFNPMEQFYRKGMGTTAYQNAWSLFDQIILSSEMAIADKGFRYYKAGIHNPSYLTQKSGSYKGYPFRTYANGVYAGGYSDHFPVYVLLVSEKK